MDTNTPVTLGQVMKELGCTSSEIQSLSPKDREDLKRHLADERALQTPAKVQQA